jgi:preprotein translocase subunit SecF
MMNIVGKRNLFFIISAIIIIPGVFSLIAFGFRLGVDFQSGTTMTLKFDKDITQEQLRQGLSQIDYSEAVIQRTGQGDYVIRVREIASDQRTQLKNNLEKQLSTTIAIRDSFTVSPIIAAETGTNAAIAIIIAAVFMLVYIVWAFRKMPKPLRWGTCAIIALLHDVLVVMGIFSILGWVAGVQIDSLFITAMLTVVGYSINNTVVVYDRIRENVRKGISRDFEVTVNSSILETMTRCLNTSLTTVFAIVAIFLFGGATIHYFITALLLGVIIGAYDSICISGSLLVVWERLSKRTA